MAPFSTEARLTQVRLTAHGREMLPTLILTLVQLVLL